MADERVLEVQKWLNKIYGRVQGFERAPENGRTGWPTIYSLREGLQHELGIKDLGEGFGEQTRTALGKKIKDIKQGYKGNIVKLIKGAFWCKGITPFDFTSDFGKYLTHAISTLEQEAGIKEDGKLSVNLMAALFDMSAFSIVKGGDSKVRAMQQYLNGKFSNELGIMPCDGIYQRGTNTALIFALQKAIGVKGANGNYGPGTIAKTPTIHQGASGNVVRVIQYGLYVNGFYEGAFDGKYNGDVTEGVINFRKFMNLPPFTGTSDLTVIKGLLTSNGNTSRDSNTADTSTQMTTQDAMNLKKYGFSIIGRYLTGSVGVGPAKRDKNLTANEIKSIISEGLSIFPIYEDGGYEVKYFNAGQGFVDAVIATRSARALGFPSGTTIYFAVDVDIQGGDIAGTVAPYMEAVISGLSNTEYHAGVYGTRNVCLHGEKLGMRHSFVADMSYGWSGNLGFKMPSNWAFDQFTGYSIGDMPIDQVASSGKDKGVSKFTPSPVKTISAQDALKIVGKSLKDSQSKLTFDHEITIIDYPYIKATLEAEAEFKNTGSNPIFTIKNGKFDSTSISEYLIREHAFPKVCAKLMVDQLGKSKLSEKISFGNVSIEVGTGSEKMYKASFIYNAPEVEEKEVTGGLALTFTVEVEPITFVKEKLGELPAEIIEKIEQMHLWGKLSKAVALVIVIGAVAGISLLIGPEEAIASAVVFILVGIKSLFRKS